MLMSNFMPYLGPSIKLLIRRGCCCCKRKGYRIQKNLNPEYQVERRYGTLLTTFYTCFTYGFMIPDIFIFASFVFFGQFVLDKLFISYVNKERVMHNDLLNRSMLRLLKYAVVLFLYFGGSALEMNHCAVSN